MRFVLFFGAMALMLSGCEGETQPHSLNEQLARDSLDKALEAWVDGKSLEELKPEIIVGDSRWEQGQKLLDFQILPAEESTDGSNLHIVVKLTLDRSGTQVDSKVTYIVGTSPVVTIFPQ